MIGIEHIKAMRLALEEATSSNDPDKAVGACFVSDYDGTVIRQASNHIVLPAYNLADKLLASAHAEKMAIHAAHQAGWANLSKLSMVVTRHPCAGCMIDIWLSGCIKVYYLETDERGSKWERSFDVAKQIAAMKNITLVKVPLDLFSHEEIADSQKGRTVRKN